MQARLLFVFGLLTLSATSVAYVSAAQAENSPDSSAKHLLRYKFSPGETLRWKVVQQAKVKTTVGGTTQTAETHNRSVKVWRILGADPSGRMKFEHSVESVDMRQTVTGRAEVRYNSTTDKEPPPGFEQAADSVGVLLSIITIDARGIIVDRQNKRAGLGGVDTQITIPLPTEPVAVGDTWSQTYQTNEKLKSGQVKKVQIRQRFTLAELSLGVATIRVDTHVLTPIDDPALEAQLIQREKKGKIRFDVDAGRVLSQQLDLDKRVVGFAGESSSLHYTMRFSEELMKPADRTARKAKPVAGPEPPPTMKKLFDGPPRRGRSANLRTRRRRR